MFDNISMYMKPIFVLKHKKFSAGITAFFLNKFLMDFFYIIKLPKDLFCDRNSLSNVI